MLEFYRKKDCGSCEEIENELKEMVIAHKVIFVNDKNNFPLPKNLTLPALKDDNKFISGEEEIKNHLEELKDYLSEWNKFQSDACYIDDDGSTC